MRQVLIAGRYRLLDLVGRGGMGRVWRARDEMLHRDVAVKQVVPPAWLADDERAELRARTLREARTAARLNHPRVVRLYDVVPVDGEPWIVMEYVPSRTLQDVLDGEGPLDPPRAARIGLAVLAALRAAHAAGVLHRDVKPQNVLVAHDGRVMLTDFGLAVFDGGDGAMTRPGMVLGSPQYVAPERAAEGVSSVEADLWSLGATLHAAVEGRSPYARSTAMATLSALASAPPDPAPHAGALAPVLAGLLRRDPRQRIDHDEAHRRLTVAAEWVGPQAPVAADQPTGDGRCADAPADRSPSPADTADRPAATGGNPTGPAGDGDVEPAVDSTAGPAGDRAPEAAEGSTVWPARSGAAEPGVGGTTGPAGGGASLAGGAGRRLLRRGALVASALLVAAAAGIGTALAVTGDGHREPNAADRRDPGPPPGPPPSGPFDRGPDRHRPPPGGPGVPPPPFPCVRPEIVGQPVPAAGPVAGERFRPPHGWLWHTDARGFRVAVPSGWRYSQDGPIACFQDPATGRALGVAGPESGDPVPRLRAMRDEAAEAGALPDYDEVRLAPSGGDTVWELRWDTPHGDRLHATQTVPGAPPGAEGWTLGWIARDSDWAGAGADWSTIRASFRPPP
ncbi:protein kinase [Micromonospora sp. NPDC094482]|uniref:serine/threonine-protein kinase n=1 Tax=unclassified Micromonospora TaxID=2617518 RepID=UPI0033303DAB